MNMLHKIGSGILDRIYPSDLYCICCGKIIDWSRAYRLCDDCMDSLNWASGRTCSKCGKLLSDNNPETICYSCRANEHVFDRGYTCTQYGAHERAIVFSLKYDDRTDIAKTIGEIMTDRMLSEKSLTRLRSEYDLIVPVPITKEKRLKRGYNQAGLISEYLSINTGIRYVGEVLERIKETTAMKGLTPNERKRNINGSFAVHPLKLDAVRGSKCLVVDDIYTTGATIDEVAITLIQNGAEIVDFISFASGADVIKS